MEREEFSLRLDGSDMPYRLVRRKNQKHINIRISHAGTIVVSAPLSAGVERIRSALRQKERWIRTHLERVRGQLAALDPVFAVPLDGVLYRVEFVEDPSRKGVVRLSEDERKVVVRTRAEGRAERLQIIERWLKRRAKQTLPQRTALLAAARRVAYTAVAIRNQRTRWGSSSGKGTITLNWRIVMTPTGVQDYLILHELAHQKHMNHSPKYWRTVAAWCPSYAAHNAWLREHGYLLGLFR